MTEQALALRESPLLPSTGEWQTMVQMAAMLVKTGFLPSTIQTGEQATAVILKGRELRIPPMYALSNIVVVSGKPTCSAELMLALVYRDHGDPALIVEESTAALCRVSYRRRGWDRPRAYAYTIGDAETAGLLGSPTWKKYPQAMLRARCISAVARMAFPDSIAGMYLPEELGAAVRVTEDGAIEVEALPAPEPPAGRSAKAQAVFDDIDDALSVTDDTTNGHGLAARVMAEADLERQERIRTAAETPDLEPVVDPLAGKRAAAEAMYQEATAAGLKPARPHPKATELALDEYVARHRRQLNARGARPVAVAT